MAHLAEIRPPYSAEAGALSIIFLTYTLVSYNLRFVQAYHSQLDALGDLHRRALLDRLREGPRSVGDLARGLPISRPAVSQHLRVLKQARLVRDHAVGTKRFYQIDLTGFADLREYFDTFWGIALENFKAKVEE
jgi:DNA-binding transcriptional ArsR family regulator